MKALTIFTNADCDTGRVLMRGKGLNARSTRRVIPDADVATIAFRRYDRTILNLKLAPIVVMFLNLIGKLDRAHDSCL